MLPFVLHEIEKQPKRQYLLLHSLKEASCSDILQHVFLVAIRLLRELAVKCKAVKSVF